MKWPFHSKSGGVSSRKSGDGRGTSPESRANLIPGGPAAIDKLSGAEPIKQETKKMDAFADMAASFGKMAEAVDKVRGVMGDDGEIDTGPDMGGIADVLNSPTAQIVAGFVAPYLPGLIEKYTGVKPVSAPVMKLPSHSETPTGAMSLDAQPTEPSPAASSTGADDIRKYLKTAAAVGPGGVKAALMVPGAREKLQQGVYDSLGMSLEDLKKATNSISKGL
jgi:hypothetical protein